jgi:hypothetical protein
MHYNYAKYDEIFLHILHEYRNKIEGITFPYE